MVDVTKGSRKTKGNKEKKYFFIAKSWMEFLTQNMIIPHLSDKTPPIIHPLQPSDGTSHQIHQLLLKRPRQGLVKEILSQRRNRLLIQLSINRTREELMQQREKVRHAGEKELEEMTEIYRQIQLKLITLNEQKRRHKLLMMV